MIKISRRHLRAIIQESLRKDHLKKMILAFVADSKKGKENNTKKAFRSIVGEYHPDQNPDNDSAAEDFATLKNLRDLLQKINRGGLSSLSRTEADLFIALYPGTSKNIYKKLGVDYPRTKKTSSSRAKSPAQSQKPAGPVSLFEDIADIIRTKKPDVDTDSKALAKMLSQVVKIGDMYEKKDEKATKEKEKTSSHDQEYFNRVISCLIAMLTMRAIVEIFESTIYKKDNTAQRQAKYASKIVNTFLKQMGRVGQGSAHGYEIDKNVFRAMLTNAGPVFGMSDGFREYNETIKSALNNAYWTGGPQSLAPRGHNRNNAYVNLDINTFKDLRTKLASEIKRIKDDPKNEENKFIQALNVKA